MSSESSHLSGNNLWESHKREELHTHICRGRLTNNESLVEVKVCTSIVCQTPSHYVHDLCECVARARTHTHTHTHTYTHIHIQTHTHTQTHIHRQKHTHFVHQSTILTNCIWTKSNLFTCSLTPWSRVILEKLIGLQLVKKLTPFYGIRKFITHSQMSATCTYPEQAYLPFFSPPGATQPIVGVYITALYWALASSRTRLFDHTQRRATVSRTPLNEWPVRRRDLYLATHNNHNRQISMPRMGFEPTIAAGYWDRP
jgi:hypothetical protein